MELEKTSGTQKQGDGITPYSRFSITGAGLKWIAIVCMLVDHIGAVIVEPIVMGGSYYPILAPKQWVMLYYILRGIGRIAFPIFAFLLVEGFTHTRNRLKYLRNLCIFAFISEVPFDFAIARVPVTLEYQNVFCTLALGLVAIWAIEYIEAKCLERNISVKASVWISLLPAVAIAFLAEWAHTDYGAVGVLVICIFYRYRQKKTLGATVVWVILALYSWIEIFALPCVGAIKLYNGKRGRQNKYFFYVFYPLHLMILYGISRLLFL